MIEKLLLVLGMVVAGKRRIKVVEDKKTVTVSPVYTPREEAKPCGEGFLLEATFKLDEGGDKMYGNVDGFAGHVISEGDVFEYEMLWEDETTHGNVDLEAVIANWRLRDDDTIRDQHNIVNHCEKTNLHDFATKKFYKRRFDLSPASGKHINTLVFSANPSQGKTEVTMLIKDIRITKKGGSSLEIWTPRMPPPTARAYFPGSIETKCKSSYLVKANASCIAEGDSSPAFERDSTDPVPMVFGRGVTCSAVVTVDQGTAKSAPPVLEVTALEVVVKHRLLDIPSLVNETWSVGGDDGTLTTDSPSHVEATFTVGEDVCTPLLRQIYLDSVVRFTATIRDTNSDGLFAKSLVDAPITLLCGGAFRHTTSHQPPQPTEQDDINEREDEEQEQPLAGDGSEL